MADYIGKYVKKFESGSLGSLALSSCGNDWGLSCGSYQLTLRWGNCINFLKKYFPLESKSLFFNVNQKDFSSKIWPGSNYCSSPAFVKSIWQKCYNKVGADKFFEYEHDWIKSNYYVPIKNKIKSILNLDIADRAFQECFWSWSVHRGSGGAYKEFKEVLDENHIISLNNVEKEKLFDLIYDKRFSYAKTNRYKKGLMNGDSERETLRPFLTKGTFSGNTLHNVANKVSDAKMKFIPRNTEPSIVDKHWIHKSKGGLNECILISGNSCLPNCVGYAWGRFYEIIGKRPNLSRANAENWYGYNDGYNRSKTPALGAVICWAKGRVGVSSDGAGHVAIVEEIKPNGDIVTSNSGYKSKRFWMQTFTKSSGYAMRGYTFLGFILPPDAEVQKPVESSNSVSVNKLDGKLKVILRTDVLNVRSSPDFGNNVVTTYSYGKIATVVGITSDNQFYKLSDGNYITTNTKYVQFTKTVVSNNFLIRVKAGRTEIKREPNSSSKTVGMITQNGVYTIVSEQNGYGKLKSGAGWISLNSKLVTRLT